MQDDKSIERLMFEYAQLGHRNSMTAVKAKLAYSEMMKATVAYMKIKDESMNINEEYLKLADEINDRCYEKNKDNLAYLESVANPAVPAGKVANLIVATDKKDKKTPIN